MNRQTSKLLTILLNSPGQYFHYEELAARFHVSTRSIRNYVQSILEFLEFLEDQNLQPVLSVSEGGIAFTGGAEESSLLLQAAVDNDFYLYRLSPEERSHIILLTLLISDDFCNIFELSEKFNVSRTTILKDMEQVKVFLSTTTSASIRP
ncbi:HTH domain-containing protein [Eisenbergiella porci]|uniref:HTH domain-containing protein n=1 Tax=Eisenbergiella porci TaxID=2652274 RepID=UPI002A841C80|nr:HTH domain-containing protein [Eisenbergiella porci]